MTLKTRADYFGAETGVRTEQIWRTTRLVSQYMGFPVQPNKAIVGAQRLLARLRPAPGRDAQGAHHLRDHDPGEHRAHGQPHRASPSTPGATPSATA